MAGQNFTKTFSGGMNKDLDISILGQNQYYHAENYQLISDDSGTSFTLENADGNQSWWDISTSGLLDDTFYLAGHCYVDPYLVLFYTQNHTTRIPDNANQSKIIRIRVDKDYRQTAEAIYEDASGDRLDISDTFPISAVGVYERDDIVKVYWTDGYNPVRFINIMDDDLSTKTVDQFELLPNFPIDTSSPGRPEFVEYTSGSLTNSSIQYAYQFFNKYNQSTAVSLLTPAIPVFPGSDEAQYPKDIYGGNVGEDSGRGIKVSITIPEDIKYEWVRLISLTYTTYTGLPTVKIVKELQIDTTDYTDSAKNLYIIDNGDSLSELTYEDFLILNRRNLVAKTIELKDNRLFIGNIVESTFDVEFDARAYRFDSSQIALLYNADNSYYRVYGVGATSYATGASMSAGDWEYYEDTVNWGTHDGADNAAVLTDTGASWVINELAGLTIYNITKGESATIISNTATTVTGTLSGSEDWDINDVYWIARDGDYGADWGIDERADCINKYNDPASESSYQYIFQSDGYNGGSYTLGAEGPNVKISFTTQDVIANTDTSEILTVAYDQDDNPNNPYNVAYNRSFQRIEIYRLGIVCFNDKLENSTTKWICDLKMPAQAQHDSSAVIATYRIMDTTGANHEFRLLGVTVTLNSGVLPSDITAWQVVMVPREEGDRSIVTTGLLQTPEEDSGEGNYKCYADLSDADDYIAMWNSGSPTYNLNALITPEIVYNRNLNVLDGDFINLVGHYDFTKDSDGADDDDDYKTSNQNNGAIFRTTGSTSTEATNANTKVDVTEGKMVLYTTDGDLEYGINSVKYNNYMWRNGGSTYERGYGGTKFVFATDGQFTSMTDGTPDHSGTDKLMVSYRRGNTDGLFGGNTYEIRQQNQYVGISDLKYSDNTSITTYEGDVIIDWFNYMYGFVEMSSSDEVSMMSILFPCESTILTALSIDKPYYKVSEDTNSFIMQEVAGSYTETISGTTYVYEQEYDLYTYNSVYSKWFGGKYYLADPSAIESENTFSTRIYASDQKIYGESEDSMSIFRINNFIDLDGNKGDLYKILNFKNQLYFWQNTGFGIVSVNPRSLITDNNPGLLTLGTGGILDRYDYIEDDIGSQNPFGIIKSRSGLYWVDNNRNELFKFDGSVKSVSKLKGLQSWINDTGQIGNVRAVYDSKFNDILFTITFSRSLNALTASAISGKIITSSLDVTTGLSLTGTTYNIGINADFVNQDKCSDRRVIYYSSGATSWLFESADDYPIGIAGSDYYVTFDNDPTYTYTVAYNEIADAFISFRSFEPIWYIPLNKNFLSTITGNDLFIHNASGASKSSYYGTLYESIVTIPFNPDFAFTKTFDTLKWISEATHRTTGVNIFKNTFSEVEVYNNYQWTGDRSLYYQHDNAPIGTTYTPQPISRRDRTWSMSIPRSIVDTKVASNPDIYSDVDESQTFKERIRDKYAMVKLTYSNSGNYKFSVPLVSIIYRKSIR